MNPSIDPFDELAALFLTEAADDPRRAAGGARGVTTELLLVGHLPVRASIWLAPYADALARAAGPTALLRLDDVSPHLQLLRGAELPAESMTLRGMIESMRQEVSLWVIKPATNEPARRLVESGPSRITVLTGADEAALVGAYQTIKQVAAAAEELGTPVPPCGISVMGSDESTVRGAVKRLNQTTHSFLGVELSLVMSLPRMDAGMIATGYRRFAEERCPEVSEVLRWIGEPADRPESAAPTPAPTPALTPASTTVAATAEPEPPTVADTVRGAVAVPPTTPAEPSPGASASPTARLKPTAAIDVEPKQPAVPREPDDSGRPIALSSHVEGLSTLPVRCPGAEDVELAVDTGGRVHLLGREQSLRRMPVVSRWAFEHRELVDLACPSHTIDLRRPPRIHLFTAAPVSVADLHATEFQLHVLTPVAVGDQVGWYAAELNKVR